MEKMKEETGTYAKRKKNLNGLTQHYQNVAARNLLNALDNFKTEDWTMSINDATPSDWDRLRKEHPAIDDSETRDKEEISLFGGIWDVNKLTMDELMKVYHDLAEKEEKEMSREELASYIVHPDDLISFTGYPKEEEEEDVVNNPSHYNTGNIECIEAIEESMTPEAYKGYLKGNCMKYLWRYDYKGKPVEDLEKAAWYLNKLIEVQEAEDE